MTIDRCLCFNVRFEDLKEIAAATGVPPGEGGMAALQREVEFGKNCELCHPYVRRMLRTGETTFHEVIVEEEEPTAGMPDADVS